MGGGYKKTAGAEAPTVLNGGKTRNRTEDTLIFSQLLYRLSYLAVTAVACGNGQQKGALGCVNGNFAELHP